MRLVATGWDADLLQTTGSCDTGHICALDEQRGHTVAMALTRPTRRTPLGMDRHTPWRMNDRPRPPALPAGLVEERSAQVARAAGHALLGRMHTELMTDAWQRTLAPTPEGVFVRTGDIDAMWLRDSSMQMRPWLALARLDRGVAEVVAGVNHLQWRMVRHDPYANAFRMPGHRLPALRHPLDNHQIARPLDPWIWERKYELDSLGLPVLLGDGLLRATGDDGHLDWGAHAAVSDVVALWRREQDHEHSAYRFVRLPAVMTRRHHDSLPRGGRGTPVARTGMTWQGFRPSDDACAFGYNIPAQLLAVRALGIIAGWCQQLWSDATLANQARELAAEIAAGVEQHGLLDDDSYAYEVDGLGGVLAVDDANLPSLLSLPLLNDVGAEDPRYLATRRRILSSQNPWWHQGAVASGIGSPHTPGPRVWPLALATQGLTSNDRDEKVRLALLMARTTGGTDRMHESFHVDDATRFTRSWFAWADMAFCELLGQVADL